MKNKLRISMFIGFLFTISLGSLLHFVYKWSNFNPIIASFSPINESTWEHLKMLFYPTLLFIVFSSIYWTKYYKNYITATVISLIIGLFSIVITFYTYTGIIGNHYLVVDILIFIFSSLIIYFLSYMIINKRKNICFPFLLNVIILTLLLLLFILFSYYAPNINLFK